MTMKASELGDIVIVSDHWNLTTNLIPAGSTWYIRAVYTTNRVALNQWDLNSLDKMRDIILQTAGNTTCYITNYASEVPLLNDLS